MSAPLSFLLEIGVEEVPDWMLGPAMAHLRAAVDQTVATLEGKVTLAEATPRRLVIQVEGLREREADREELVTGPPKSANPQALAGFAKKQGITVEELSVVETPRGEFHGFMRKIGGRTAEAILEAELPGLILGIPWPKSMAWLGKGTARFIRPLRWIVALLGERTLAVTVAGVIASNETWGRRQGSVIPKSTVPSAASYHQKLQDLGILLASEDRKQRILAEAAKVLPAGLRLKGDRALLDTLAGITEYPTPILGAFDSSYLALPAEVLVTVMRFHQKYFSVESGDGKLAPYFVAVMNAEADAEGLVKQGNERVLRARFNDARFFYDADQKRPLADRVADLEKVTFQAQLGSYLEKTNRMVDLVRELGGSDAAVEAARLAKADLTTEMVKEFTELQGQVGGVYAKAQGHPEAVGQAIYEHYKPLSMEDSIPSTSEGQLVSLADKADTLRGCFRIGMIPKGSSDPFALRRAAQGLVKILAEGSLAVTTTRVIAGDAQLEKFLLDRVDYYFREIRGFAYDEVNAVLAAGWADLRDVQKRLDAVRDVRKSENFEPLAAAFKRIKNILKQARFERDGAVDPARLEPGPEQELHAEYERVRAAAHTATGYGETLAAIATLRPAVDRFFDAVMVNVEDAAVRENRLTLLRSLLVEFSTLADFSEIVTLA